MSTDVDIMKYQRDQQEGSARREYVFSAMSWLSVVIISCWVGWLLGTGCGISSIQDQLSSADIPTPGSSTHRHAVEPVVDPAMTEESRPAEPESIEGGAIGTLDQAASELARVSERPVTLTREAQRLARCVTVPLFVPGAPAGSAEQLLRSSIEAAGFTFVEGEAASQIVPAADVLFLACSSRSMPPLPEHSELRELSGRVRQITRRERELSREDFVKLALLSRTAPSDERLVPYVRDGEMVGVKLYRTEAQGLSGLLGFDDGDVITHVAGQRVSTTGSAVRISSEESKIVVRVLRDGEPIDLQYTFMAGRHIPGARDLR